MVQTTLITRETVAEICAHRDRALELYDVAHAKLMTANAAINEATGAAMAALLTRKSYNYHSREEDNAFLNTVVIPPLDNYRRAAKRMVDSSVWARIIEISEIEKFMDKKAREELRQSLISDPPEATEDNIHATMETLMGQADMMFRRGVAECFSHLDRRFKSHDGWKTGDRIILSCAINDSGRWSCHNNHQDTIADIERVFYILDDIYPPGNYYGVVAAVDRERGSRLERWAGKVETEFFRVRIYKNGNVYMWFKRDDLLEKVNKILGE